MSTIRFVLRTDKPDQSGLFPVQLIYQVSGQRKYFASGEKLRSENWDSVGQQALFLNKKEAKKLLPTTNYDSLPTSKEIENINSNLIALKREVAEIESRFELNKVIYSPAMVVQALKDNRSPLTKTEAPANHLYDFIDKYIEDHKTTREPGSLSVYKSLKNHLQAFQNYKHKKIGFENIDYSFFQEFQNFLISARRLNNTTVAKQLSTVKTFLNYARKHGYSINESYKDFTIKKENLEVIALTSEEFESLYNLDLSKNKKLDQVRDVFCFTCTTGLRFSDVAQLKREHIKADHIRIIVKKTREQLTIPLTKYSAAILAKYTDMHRPLPVISNQKTNEYLKELCKKAGLDEPTEIVRFRGAKRETNVYPKYQLISVHTGRKTFCTLSLEKGLSAEEVMAISGHKDYRSFKRYVKITEKRSQVVMYKAWGKARKSVLKAV